MLRHILFLSFCMLLTQNSLAEDNPRYYDIEFILFEHLGDNGKNSENWQLPRLSQDSATEKENTHVLGENYVMNAKLPYDPKLMFVPLSENEFRLTEEARKLKNSQSRSILMHQAWRQAGLPDNQAVRVKFKHVIGEQAKSPQPSNADQLASLQAMHNPYIEGSIKVILSRYLHADANILYFKPAVVNPVSLEDELSNREITSTQPQNLHDNYAVYQLKEFRRRIRSTEVHYLDHPVFGMLLMITPYEPAQEAAGSGSKP